MLMQNLQRQTKSIMHGIFENGLFQNPLGSNSYICFIWLLSFSLTYLHKSICAKTFSGGKKTAAMRPLTTAYEFRFSLTNFLVV